MKNFIMNETTDILVTKCFGQSIFLKKSIDIKTDFFLNPPEWRDGYMLSSELVYNENGKSDDSDIFNFNQGDSLEYVFYRISADINDSFTGNSANLEMFYLSRVNIPGGDNKGNNSLYENFSEFENKLCSSPMYIEYLTLVALKNGRGNIPEITIKDLDLDTLTDDLIYFKQPDIMLYNGNYVLPRDIPPLLLLEIYKLFSKKLGFRVMCFNSFTNSESPVANFINTALYNYRRDMVYLNFGSMIMSRYNTDYNLYADTAVRLYTDKYNIRLIFPEGALLSDLSDMRCIADEYSEEISEETYLPKRVILEFFYNL
ncbi:MAG: hypothetical protein LUD77_08235, partial [Clostridiales bacterium]|nr:hypothetical protein [Clostridiales bacterium]